MLDLISFEEYPDDDEDDLMDDFLGNLVGVKIDDVIPANSDEQEDEDAKDEDEDDAGIEHSIFSCFFFLSHWEIAVKQHPILLGPVGMDEARVGIVIKDDWRWSSFRERLDLLKEYPFLDAFIVEDDGEDDVMASEVIVFMWDLLNRLRIRLGSSKLIE